MYIYTYTQFNNVYMYKISISTVCRFIYFSSEGSEVTHERVCAQDNHDKHIDVYVDGSWKPTQELCSL